MIVRGGMLPKLENGSPLCYLNGLVGVVGSTVLSFRCAFSTLRGPVA
jgi:hypothetical protein